MTLEVLGPEELLKSPVRGFRPSGAMHVGFRAPRPPTFLLEPGGQDYVGSNSYDNTDPTDE